MSILLRNKLLVPVLCSRPPPFERNPVASGQILQPPSQQAAACSTIGRGDNHAGLGQELAYRCIARIAPAASSGNIGIVRNVG
jgi:hypothetical protein